MNNLNVCSAHIYLYTRSRFKRATKCSEFLPTGLYKSCFRVIIHTFIIHFDLELKKKEIYYRLLCWIRYSIILKQMVEDYNVIKLS